MHVTTNRSQLFAVLPRCAHHPLIRLAQLYDFAPVVAACQAYYHAPGTKGTPPTSTIDQLVRAEIVRAWADTCSDPALEELLSTNLLVRWFVNLPLTQPGPDHRTLADFHAFLTTHAPDAFFCDVLTFLGKVDPEPPAATPQIVDTFAMERPVAASLTVAHLLAHLTLRLARLWLAHAPRACQCALPPLDLSGRVRLAIARTTLARQQRLQSVLTVVDWVVAGLTVHLGALEPALRSAVQDYRDALAKVLSDELTTDAGGVRSERTTSPHGVRRLASAVDIEATFRKHAGHPAVLGTNAVISTTATRIRACVALTGCTPDSAAPVAVLEQQQAAGRPLPPQLIMDQAAGWGKVRASTVAAFVVDAARTTGTCPNGVVSTNAYAHGDSDGLSFRFLASQCRDCPLWASCRDPDANPKGHRSVFISDEHLYLRAADAFNHTPDGRALLKSRWRVEPTVAWLVRYQGCRRARRVGQAAAQGQLYQACALRNLLRWRSRVRRGQAPRPVRA